MNDMDARFVSYAQHGEDVIIWRALGSGPPGFYVDVGAFDPTLDSVTKALYERGWHGINVEPQKTRIDAFEKERPRDVNVWAAAGDMDGETTLYLPANPGWATIEPTVAQGMGGDSPTMSEVVVPLRRLDSILSEHGVTHVDVLKIDVEGAEAAVIRGLDLAVVHPRVLVVEGVAPTVGRASGVEAVELLVAAGYTHCQFDGLNHYLTCEADLVDKLTVPANPLDMYVRSYIHDLEVDRQKLISTIRSLTSDDWGATPTSSGEAVAEDIPLPVAMSAPRIPAPAVHVDPEVRQARRRTAVKRQLTGDVDLPLAPSVTPDLVRTPIARALESVESSIIVSGLYMAILGRRVDAEALESWTALLDSGVNSVALAYELASSPEAETQTPAHRAAVMAELAAWASKRALGELGYPVSTLGGVYTPGAVAEEILVYALFQAASGRPPSPGEMAHELERLRSGVGRAQLIRTFAQRPEAGARLVGARRRGLRSSVRRVMDRLARTRVFRQSVLASETQQVLALVAQAVGGPPSAQSGQTNHEAQANQAAPSDLFAQGIE